MINIARANIDFPFLAINLHVLHKLEEAHNNVELGVAYKAKAKPVLRTLECFLQITNRKLNDSILQSPAFGEIICLYAGALYSKKIFEITNQTTYTYLCILSRLCEQSQKLFDSYPFPSLKFHLTKPSLDAINCVEKFEKLELNEEKVWLQAEKRKRQPELFARDSNSVIAIGRNCLEFLACVGRLYQLENFIGRNGQIKAEEKEFYIKQVSSNHFTGKGKPTRKYWTHRAFPTPDPQKKRLPIGTEAIDKIRKVILPTSSSIFLITLIALDALYLKLNLLNKLFNNLPAIQILLHSMFT